MSVCFRHRSLGEPNYDTLEFLGDAVLDLILADQIYEENIGIDNMSRFKCKHRSNKYLAGISRKLGLTKYFQSSNTFTIEESIKSQADIIEAILGLVYKRHGFKKAQLVYDFLIFKALYRSQNDSF